MIKVDRTHTSTTSLKPLYLLGAAARAVEVNVVSECELKVNLCVTKNITTLTKRVR